MKRPSTIILMATFISFVVFWSLIDFHRDFRALQSTRQDDATALEVPDSSAISFASLTTLYHNWTVNLDGIENREDWSITILFDNKEFLFSYEEFKAVIENARADSVYVGKWEPLKIGKGLYGMSQTLKKLRERNP